VLHAKPLENVTMGTTVPSKPAKKGYVNITHLLSRDVKTQPSGALNAKNPANAINSQKALRLVWKPFVTMTSFANCEKPVTARNVMTATPAPAEKPARPANAWPQMATSAMMAMPARQIPAATMDARISPSIAMMAMPVQTTTVAMKAVFQHPTQQTVMMETSAQRPTHVPMALAVEPRRTATMGTPAPQIFVTRKQENVPVLQVLAVMTAMTAP